MWLRLLTLSLLLPNCCPTDAGQEPNATPQDVTYCQLAKDHLHSQENESAFVPSTHICLKCRVSNRRRAAPNVIRLYG
jgi:hypothetical protein